MNKTFWIGQMNSLALLLIGINVPLWFIYLLYLSTNNELSLSLFKMQIWTLVAFLTLPIMIIVTAIDKVFGSSMMLKFSVFLSTAPELFNNTGNLFVLSLILCGVGLCLMKIYESSIVKETN